MTDWSDADYAQAALDMLPDTPEEITEFFRVQGISGERCKAATCPIARWVSRWTGSDVWVGSFTIGDGRCGVPRLGKAGEGRQRRTPKQQASDITDEELAKLELRFMHVDHVSRLIAALRASRAENERLRAALEFYADPNTYFAIGFLPDPPCGEFMDDWSEHGNSEFPEEDQRPGRRAREALGL